MVCFKPLGIFIGVLYLSIQRTYISEIQQAGLVLELPLHSHHRSSPHSQYHLQLPSSASPEDTYTTTMSIVCMSPLNPDRRRPSISSPLAGISSSRAPLARTSSKSPSFPTSRPLRPFASVSGNLPSSGSKKAVKLIEPPKGFEGGFFVLNLTQAELSRTD